MIITQYLSFKHPSNQVSEVIINQNSLFKHLMNYFYKPDIKNNNEFLKMSALNIILRRINRIQLQKMKLFMPNVKIKSLTSIFLYNIMIINIIHCIISKGDKMYKKNSSLILFLLSFICFYLSTVFELDYLNIAFIPMFIFYIKKTIM